MATTTLSSGVNLPARLVIIRTPLDARQTKSMSSRTFQQMCGRAGRKGVDSEGHAVLMTDQKTFKLAKTLLQADSEFVKSQMGAEHLHRALLEFIVNCSEPVPIKEAVKFIKTTFHACQIEEQDQVINESISFLHTSQIEDASYPPSIPNNTNEGGGMSLAIKKTVDWLRLNQFVQISDKAIAATKLGAGCIAAGIDPKSALIIYDDLETAKYGLNLETDLHLIYLCTPMSVFDNMKDKWEDIADTLLNLNGQKRRVLELVCPNNAPYIKRMSRIGTKGSTPENICGKLKRFFYALALYDLAEEKTLVNVSAAYKVPAGTMQSIQQQAAKYAGTITAFCEELSWVHMTNLLSKFQSRIEYGVHADLLDLVRCTYLNSRRARALYKAGFKTLDALAAADKHQIVKILKKLDAFVSDGKTLLYLPGIRQNLTYEEAAEIITNDAKLVAYAEEPKTHNDSKAQMMTSFDESLSSVVIRDKRTSMVKPITPITQTSISQISRPSTPVIPIPKLQSLDELYKSQRKEKRQSIERITTELQDASMIEEPSDDSESSNDSVEMFEFEADVPIETDEDQTPDLQENHATDDTIADVDATGEDTIMEDAIIDDTGSEGLFEESLIGSIDTTPEPRASKRQHSQDKEEEPKRTKYDLSSLSENDFTKPMSKLAVDDTFDDTLGRELQAPTKSNETFDDTFDQELIEKDDTLDKVFNEPTILKTPAQTSPPKSANRSTLPIQLSPQTKRQIEEESRKPSSVRKNLFSPGKTARQRDIDQDEIEKFLTKTLTGRDAVVVVDDKKSYFCPVESQTDSIYTIDKEFHHRAVDVLNTVICFDVVALSQQSLIKDSTNFFDVEVLCWFSDTRLPDAAGCKIRLEKATHTILGIVNQTKRDECLAIVKLYRKLTSSLSPDRLTYLTQYEMKHVMCLENMRHLGLPCSDKAIISTKKALGKFIKKSLNNLERAGRKVDLSNLDVTNKAEQKTLVNKIITKQGHEPLNRITNEHLTGLADDFHAIGDLLNYRRLVKAVSDLDTYKDSIKNGRIHPTINYLNLTGRITMDAPALQMVQKVFRLYPHDKGKEIALRNVFRASEGFTFVAGDYSQLELRILAGFSNDEKLIHAFNSTNVDPFREVAKDWFQKNDINDDERAQVKSALYGKISFLSLVLNCI